eukprot:6980936-Alexandrium_andersonii.AAC.1
MAVCVQRRSDPSGAVSCGPPNHANGKGLRGLRIGVCFGDFAPSDPPSVRIFVGRFGVCAGNG